MSAVASLGLPGRAHRAARIIAVPLARPRTQPSAASDTAHAKVLTYYQFQLSTPLELPASGEEGAGGAGKRKGWLPEEGVSLWAQNKASALWASWGKADGGWKLKTFQTGERLMDRLDFEELALKSVDPSMAPTIAHPTKNGMMEEDADGRVVGPLRIPLLYPSSMATPEGVLAQLRRDTSHRTPVHRKGFVFWAVVAPFTLPFMIVPVIPNLPFFFCAWRSWSHFRAYRSSQYLQSLLEKGVLVPQASPILDALYKEYPASSPFSDAAPPKEPVSAATPPPAGAADYEVLLEKNVVPQLVQRFGLEDSTQGDLYRALEQARVRVVTGKVGL